MKVVEKWNIKGKYRRVFVIRESGKLKSWRFVKGSGLKKSDALKIFKKNKSFYRDKSVQKLTRFKEVTILKKSSFAEKDKKIITPRPGFKLVQYVVKGYYKDKIVIARSSQGIRSKEAKEEAWRNFLARINVIVLGGASDEDEGIKHIDKIKNIKEGWVYYKE